MNQQNGYNAWAVLGQQCGQQGLVIQGLSAADWQQRSGRPSDAQVAGMQQAALANRIGQQQAMQAWPSPEAMAAVQKYMDNHPETKERRAQRMAQEVRERKPSMQVQRRTRREA